MNNSDFCHLHLHTEYSLLDGLGTPDAYAKRASEMGFKYLGITDHGSMNGLIGFQKACDKYDISPVLGCEAYIVPDATIKKDKKRGHISLWVKNQKGFNNLCRLLTYANLEGFYYRPRIDYNILLKHCEGLVISTACCSSFLTKCEKGIDFFYRLLDEAGEDLYCEIMPHQMDGQTKINKLNIRLARTSGCKIIVTNDCHYIKRDEWKAQEVLLAIQSKKRWSDPKRWKFDIRGLHLRTANEMIRASKKVGFYKREYLLNTMDVAKKCSGFRIPKRDIHLPRVKGVSLKEKEFLWNLCLQGYENKFKKLIRNPYCSRLKEEYNLIVQKKFIRYFLIVWELVNWCRQSGILVGCGRGSASGSLVSFLLGITAIDPIQHKLLFSRFINKDRIDYPDIDIDFEHDKRHLIKQHLETMYGSNHIANVSSFNRMKARAVIKDVSRVFDIPFDEVNSFTNLIEDNDEHTGIQDAIDNYQEGKSFDEKYPKIVKIAKVLEGQIKNNSQHAAALIVSKEPLEQSERCNLLRRKDTLLINWERNNAEYVGLMKLDALGLKLLSIFGETIRLVKDNYNQIIDINKINIEDKVVLKEINKGNTVGLFQLGTPATTNLIDEMGIKKFNDLRDAIALVRPGIMNCVTGDSLIRTWSGREIRIDEIEIGRPISSSSFAENQGRRYIRNKVKNVICSGERVVFEIKTSDNKTIKATILHRFFVKRQRTAKHYWAKKTQYQKKGEWCSLRKIKVGDKILTRCLNLTIKKNTKHNRKLLSSGRKTRFGENHIPWNKGIKRFMDYFYLSSIKTEVRKQWAKKRFETIYNDPEKLKRFQENMKKMISGHSKPDFRKKQSALMIEYYSDHIHPNATMPAISDPQLKIFKEIKKWFLDAELEYKFRYIDSKGNKRFFLLDIVIPIEKINIEYDGDYWHDFPGERHELRDSIIEKDGWKIIRVNKETIADFIEKIPCLCRHNNIKFSKVLSIKKIGKILTYDIVTENQNFPNYIANDFIVHNSGMTAEYIRRKHGGSWERKHEMYEEITKDTYGVVVFQEQVMMVINKIAGLPYSTADQIRKIIGKKRSRKEFMPYKKRFIDGCLKQKTLSRIEAKEFWDGLEEHSKYSFNLSHSVAYALLGYQSAWLKKYYPTEFICASLTCGAKDKKPLLIDEAYRLGLNLVLPKVGVSDAVRWVAKEGKLYIPFIEIRGVGPAKASEAVNINTSGDIKKFFTKKKDIVRHAGSLGKLLTKINAYNLSDNVQINDEAKSYFDFRIESDPCSNYKKLFSLFDNKIRLDRLDKILVGNSRELKKISKKIIGKITFQGHENLIECTACELREECKMPVSPSPGVYNIIICGEAPGPQEDEHGRGFYEDAPAGKLLWKVINKRGYKREDFHLTNIGKCFPKISRKPNAKQIKICGKFLKKEIEEVRPRIILAFGNTSLQFFIGQKTGITNMSGKVTWNEEYGAWVVWCLHPAATFYAPENRKIFGRGMKSFFRLLRVLGMRKINEDH